ncbi:MAG: hypothetical protein HY525_00230 [Betaproteobacteria bacterium]|nr:hypothetical protein [Betaproteobacteria bacterium]
MAVWGRFSYDNSAEPVPLKRRLAWCTSCKDLVPLEVLPTETTVRELESEIAHKAKIVADFMTKAEHQKTWFQKLLGSSVKMSAEIQDVDFQRSYREDELKDERARAKFLIDRRSGPKCLLCGSEDCLELPTKISPRGTDRAPGPPMPIGMKHPRCGGEFLVEHSGIRISKRLNHRVYDREGTLLRVLEDR